MNLLKMTKRKEKIGIVVSDKMDKTRVVEIERLVKHPVYSKVIKKFSKFKVDDPKNKSKIGERVKIRETRPLSRDKKWRIV